MTAFVDAYREQFDVDELCRLIRFPVSTYYAAKERERNPSDRTRRDAEITELIRAEWEASGQLYGAKKVWHQLRRQGSDVARCTVERLMRAAGMSGQLTPRRRPRTTVPTDEGRPADLVGRDFTTPAPNRLWVTDITYVELPGHRFCYTALVTDAFSRAIIGWQVADSLHTELALDALEMALWTRQDTLSASLVHHSDRGVQYTAIRYGQRLDESRIARSVGSTGDSYDNALAESINALYKKELIHRNEGWNDASEVTLATAEWVHWYNHQRLHSWCGHTPPMEYEQAYWHAQREQTLTAT